MGHIFWRVAGGADIAQRVAAGDVLSVVQTMYIVIEMGIVVHEPFLFVHRPDDVSAEGVDADFDDGAIVSGEHWRSALGENVNGVMDADAIAGVVECVWYFAHFDTGHWYHESPLVEFFQIGVATV